MNYSVRTILTPCFGLQCPSSRLLSRVALLLRSAEILLLPCKRRLLLWPFWTLFVDCFPVLSGLAVVCLFCGFDSLTALAHFPHLSLSLSILYLHLISTSGYLVPDRQVQVSPYSLICSVPYTQVTLVSLCLLLYRSFLYLFLLIVYIL